MAKHSRLKTLTSSKGDAQLVGKEKLLKLLHSRQIVIEPILDPQSQIHHVGVDLRLDCFFREFVRTEHPYVSPAKDSDDTLLREIEPFRDSFLQPGEFALAQSLEYIALPNSLLGILNGRSSLGRRGLVVHATANVVDPGWRGHLVFELANLGTMPIQLVPLMRVARVIFLQVGAVEPYAGQYEGQIRITPPKADEFVSELRKRGLLRQEQG